MSLWQAAARNEVWTMGGEGGDRSPEEIAREHERIQR